MGNKIKILLICSIAPFITACQSATLGSLEEDTVAYNDSQSLANQDLSEYCKSNGVEGAAFYVESDANKSGQYITYGTMQNDSAYALASGTKMYTAAVIMCLDSEGLIQLDDTIDMYFSESELDGLDYIDGTDYADTITIRELLGHTSGLPDYFSESSYLYSSTKSRSNTIGDFSYSFEDVLDMTKELTPHFYPGEEGECLYSDANYQLLGQIIERATGESLSECYSEYIFTPLGLKDTYLFAQDMIWGDIMPIKFKNGYGKRPLFTASEKSTGGIISTLTDVMVFLKAFWNGQIFDSSYLYEIQDYNELNLLCDYGLGVMQYNLGYEIIGHTGSFGTVAFYCPSKNMYITGTLNNCNSTDAVRIAYSILNLY